MGRRRLRATVGLRFAAPVALAVVALGGITSTMVRRTVQGSLTRELHARSESQVGSFALGITPAVLRDDRLGLEAAVDEALALPDCRYVVIVGARGGVLASSFPAGVPVDLAGLFERPRPQGGGLAFRSEQGVIVDHVAPLIGGRIGAVHIGVDQERVRRTARDQSRLILSFTGLGALLTGGLAATVAHLVTGPLRQLAAQAGRVGTREPASVPPPVRDDEVGDLALAFAAMVERLDRQQAEVDAAQRRLVQAERLAVVGKLAAGVAHEIGNPLHAGRQFLESLRESPDLLPRYLRLLDQAFERMDRVIGQLLSYSAERRIDPRSLEPAAAVDQALDFLRFDHRTRQVRLERRCDADLPRILVDPDALQQVLVNLIVNALDALGEQGRIVVSVGRQRGERGEDGVVFAVTDDGPGVPAALAERVFDPFFTTKEPGQGTGLGLSVSQELVAAQGGRLSLVQPGAGGARFEAWFPAASTPSPEKRA